jgi:hypothetical protein
MVIAVCARIATAALALIKAQPTNAKRTRRDRVLATAGSPQLYDSRVTLTRESR